MVTMKNLCLCGLVLGTLVPGIAKGMIDTRRMYINEPVNSDSWGYGDFYLKQGDSFYNCTCTKAEKDTIKAFVEDVASVSAPKKLMNNWYYNRKEDIIARLESLITQAQSLKSIKIENLDKGQYNRVMVPITLMDPKTKDKGKLWVTVNEEDVMSLEHAEDGIKWLLGKVKEIDKNFFGSDEIKALQKAYVSNCLEKLEQHLQETSRKDEVKDFMEGRNTDSCRIEIYSSKQYNPVGSKTLLSAEKFGDAVFFWKLANETKIKDVFGNDAYCYFCSNPTPVK